MTAFKAQIQNAASDVVLDHPVTAPDEVILQIETYDWVAERARRDDLAEQYIDPQLSIVSTASGDVLHIIPETAGTYELWLHTDSPSKLFGIFPTKTNILLTASSASDTKMRSAIMHFMTGNTAWFTANFQKD